MSKRLSFLQKGNGQVGRSSSSNASNEPAPPPAYREVPDAQAADLPTAEETDQVNLTAAFENLKISSGPSDPTVETCLAHLKLLFAFQSMKEDVGYTDGLWGLWDSLAGLPEQLKGSDEKPPKEKIQDKKLAVLSKIREKRWALFVARAVERYEAWWKSMPAFQLTEKHMETPAEYYLAFPTETSHAMQWSADKLPPLGMLWISYPISLKWTATISANTF